MAKKDFSKSQIGRFMESTSEPIKDNLPLNANNDANNKPLNAKEHAKDKTPKGAIDNSIDYAGEFTLEAEQKPALRIAKKKKEETKSKRVNLLIKPSLFSKASKQAKKLGYKSFNDFINAILEQIVEGE